MEAQSDIYNMRSSFYPWNMTEWGIVVFQGFSATDENDFKSIFQLENEKLDNIWQYISIYDNYLKK